MWRETKILLIDDNNERRRDLTVILSFLGEDYLACDSASWRETVAELESNRSVLSVLLGEVQAKGGVLEILKQVAAWDEFLPTLLLNEQVAPEWPEEQRRSVLATLDMPLSYNKLLDSLHRAQVYQQVFDVARERGLQREVALCQFQGALAGVLGLDRGDVGIDADDAAFVRAVVGDLNPAAVAPLHQIRAARIAVAPQALAHPLVDTAARGPGVAAPGAGEGARCGDRSGHNVELPRAALDLRPVHAVEIRPDKAQSASSVRQSRNGRGRGCRESLRFPPSASAG